MMHMKGFFDLCIQESFFDPSNIEHAVKCLYDYGYRTIAINHPIGDERIEPKKKKKKGEPRHNVDLVPTPFNVETIMKVAEKLGYEDFKVLTRLTISFSNQDLIHKVTKSSNYKKFDIVASMPVTAQALAYTCSNFEADIFTIDASQKFSLRLTRKMYNQLIERGYFFELLYSPCIEDSTKRKNMIQDSHMYHTYGKSKNVIFCSGAENFRLIRSPYDIINMGVLFGLSQLKCRTSINEYPRKVILHSIGRRHGKAVIFVENVEEKDETIEDSGIKVEVTDRQEPKLKKSKFDAL